jgi:hypothetical protein
MLFLLAVALILSFEVAALRWLQQRGEANWHIWAALILWIACVGLLVSAAIALTAHS